MKRRLLAFTLAFTMAFSTLVTVNAEDVSNSVQDEVVDTISDDEAQNDADSSDSDTNSNENSVDNEDEPQEEISNDIKDEPQEEISDSSNDEPQEETSDSSDDEQQNGSSDGIVDESQEQSSETETSTALSEENANADINLDAEVSDWIYGKNTNGIEAAGKADHNVKVNSDKSVTIAVKSANKGKWSDKEDTITYYAPKDGVDITKDFVFSATMKIDDLNTISGGSNEVQSSAGMVIIGTPVKDDKMPPSVSLGITMETNSSAYIGSNTRAGIDAKGKYNPEVRPVSNKSGHTFVRLSDSFSGKGKDVGTFDLKIEKVGYSYTVYCGDQSQKYEFAKENFMGKDGTNTLIYPSLFSARNATVTFSNVKLDVDERIPVGIEILNDATDRTALVGNAPKLPGLQVAIKYDDGSLKEFPEGEGYVLSDYDMNSVGKQKAKIVIGELSLDYDIEILKKTCTGIKVASYPMKNSYHEGQHIVTDNLVVTANYNDGSEDVVLERKDYEILVKGKVIGENDFITSDLAGDDIDFVIRRKETPEIGMGSATTSFKASISSLKLNSLNMEMKPAKRIYYVGEETNLRGVYKKGSYKSDDGKIKSSNVLSESEYSVAFKVKNADGSLGRAYDEIDTSKEGKWVIEIASKFNPSLTTSTEVAVYNKIFSKVYISSYPRTTYPRLTDVGTYDARKWYDHYNGKPDGITTTEGDETKQYNQGNLEVKYVYTNGAEEIIPEGEQYQIDLSNFDITNPNKTPNQIVVKFPEGSMAYGTEDFVIPITVKEDYNKNYWKPIIFGAATSPTASRSPAQDKMGIIFKDKNGTETHFDVRNSNNKENYNKYIGNENPEEEGATLRLWANGGAGKLADSNDGLSYYYTRLNAKDAFKLSADILVNSYIQEDNDLKRDGQEGFGIMARDVVSFVPKGGSGQFVYKPEDAELDENGEPVPYSVSTYNYANMVFLGGGVAGGSWPKDPDANNFLFNATKNRINFIYRTFIKGDPYNASSDVLISDVKKVLSSDKLPEDIINNPSEAEGFPGPGKRYHLVLERVKGGYKGTCYDYQSKEFKTNYIKYDKDTQEEDLDVLDPDNLYVGFFATRYADIEVSNVNLIKSDLETSMESILEETEQLSTPKLYLYSNLYSSTTNYNLVIRTSNNSGGYVTILQDNDKVICSDSIIKKYGTVFPVTLNENTKTKFTVKFTPIYITEDSDDYQPLSSYDPVYYTYEISHNGKFDKTRKFVYVSPEKDNEQINADDPVPLTYGSPDGTGEITNPITFDVALGLMEKGQTMILLPGVYKRTKITEIPTTNGGIPAKRMAIIGYNKYQADEEGYAVSGVEIPDGDAIFDLTNGNNGFVNHASYWTFKNFHIRNGGKNAKPFHSGGNNCIIENLKIYDSQDSGMNLSRSSSNQVTINDWPSNNLIKNCEVWNCKDSSANNADGFAIKLTVGYGNKLVGCVSHHNSDDGWDLFCKQSGGYRAPITLEKCITYKGGYQLQPNGKDDSLWDAERGGRNGFKMGGDNMNVNDIMIDCIAFENGNSGVTSNSNPWMTIDGCVGYNNDGANFNLYSSAMKDSDEIDPETGKPKRVSMCDYKVRSVVSYKSGASDSIQGYKYDKEYNYLQRQKGGKSVNSANVEVTDDFFVSLKNPVVKGHIPQDPKTGDFLTNGFLQLKDSVKNQIENSPGYEDDFTTTATETESENSGSSSGSSSAIHGSGGGSTKKSNSSSKGSSSSSNNSNNNSTSNNSSNTEGSNANTNEGNSTNTEGSKIESTKPQINEKTVDVEADNGAKISVPESLKDKVSVSSSDSFGGNAVSVEFDSNVAPKTVTGWVEIPFNGDTSNPDKIIAVVTDKDGNQKIVKAGFYDEATGKVLAPAIGSGVYGAILTDVSFDDMEGNWAKPYVEALAARGIVNGINDNTFAPNAKIKRGDFVLMLANVIDIDSSNDAGFSDVSSSDYYSNAIAAAKENGLVKGISASEFGAKENISRQDVMTIIARTLESAGIKLNAADVSQFSDSDMISDYAKEAISKLVGEGIISGNNGAVNPKDNLSRAEASKILYEVWKRF